MADTSKRPAGDDASLGAVIRAHREAAGYSIRQLAAMAGMHYSYLARLENGDNDRPTADVLQRLSEALEIDADELLRFIGVKPTLPAPRTYYRRAYRLTDEEAAEADRRMQEFIAELQKRHKHEPDTE
ncbi:MAG TPA: helix-turn-helix transcriptional regulator [Mycobacteriales bacterium]|nr:helix-turn-helix transcriptional regulator [Mycobacteriales bacterium]